MEVLHSVINLLYVCCKSTGMLQVYVYVHSAINLLKYMGMLQGFPCESVHPATSVGWSEGAGGLCSQAERSRGVQQEPCLAQEGCCGHPHQVSHYAPYCFCLGFSCIMLRFFPTPIRRWFFVVLYFTVYCIL